MLFARVQPVNDCDEPDFGCAEHLLLWACRRSRDESPAGMARAIEFLEACGEDGLDVLSALDMFVEAMAMTKRRRAAFGAPGAHSLTQDEQHIVTLLAACQRDRPDIAERCLERLVDADCRPLARMAAGTLAKAFLLNGLELHFPAPTRRNRCPQSALAA
ncbi:MAG: hypothetical protein WCY29_07550 [Novosphingobium sp.]